LIKENLKLSGLNGLGGIDSIQGQLTFLGNPQLHDLQGLTKLIYARSINIQNNSTLESLDGLSTLKVIGGNLVIDYNPSMVQIAGLSNLESMKANCK
jgi:hypothetical protein